MGMIIHKGGITLGSVDGFRSLEDPKPMGDMHYPIRHDYFLDLVKGALVPKGWEIAREEYALHQDAKVDNSFALLHLRSDGGEHSRVLGCRNSGTQHFSAQVGVGQHVTVCDNLLFSAAIVVGRKHTKNIMRDLPRLVTNAMGRASDEFVKAEVRTEAYKVSDLNRTETNHIMMETIRAKAIPPSQLMHWVNEWDKPSHEEFEPRTAWSLQNAFTEVAKRWAFPTMQSRTHGLIGVLDRVIDVQFPQTELLEGVEDGEVLTV
jgi:hypothetical protein